MTTNVNVKSMGSARTHMMCVKADEYLGYCVHVLPSHQKK